MHLLVTPGGTIRCIYDEVISLSRLGTPTIRRRATSSPMPTANAR